MLKVKFPASFEIEVPQSHQALLEKCPHPETTLISRVLSLFPLPSHTPKVKPSDSDFSLALFGSYAQLLKEQLMFMFQSIFYKLFIEKKCTLVKAALFNEVKEKLAFGKQGQ